MIANLNNMNLQQQIDQHDKWLQTEFAGWKVQRWEIINFLIKKFNFKTYLEIGVAAKENFDKIQIENKECVDPIWDATYKMTSDRFFNEIHIDKKYDLIFIDGLHHDYQVYRDILNSLEHLNKNGFVVCHDMNPLLEICQMKDQFVTVWNGDCWKAFVKLRSERQDLEMFVIDTDWGIGIIKRGNQDTIVLPYQIDFSYFEKNKIELLNLITVDSFFKKFEQ